MLKPREESSQYVPAAPLREQAELYIEALTGSRDAPVTLQAFAEGGPSDSGPRILHGTLDQHWDELCRLNRAGHGIFVMVNEGDGRGRSGQNVIGLRALFTDDDGTRQGPVPSVAAAPPSMVVQSKHGPHSYWLLSQGEPLEAFTPAQAALAKHFGTDTKVKDLPRVMRVPGFFHQKDRSRPFLVTVMLTSAARYTIDQVTTAFGLSTNSAANEDREHAARSIESKEPTHDLALAIRRASGYLAKVPGAIQGEHGDDITYRVACTLIRDFGLPLDGALDLFRAWNQTCTPPWSDDQLVAKLEHAEKYATGEEGAKLKESPRNFGGTEDLCFVVPLEHYFYRLPSGQWDIGSPMRKEAAQKHLRSRGLPEKAIANIMGLDLMPLAHGVDCAPGQPPTFDREGRLTINNYRPPRIKPTAGVFPRIQRIIETVTGGEADAVAWLMNWMASKYQNPGARGMTAPVFQGAQGLGKTKLGVIFAMLLGQENTASISQADLESQFNGFYAMRLFIVADEVVNQDNLRDTASMLKKYITDPWVCVNIKNTPQFQVENRMAWWFTSNSVTPVRVEGPHDRRYTVFAVLEPPTQEYKAMLEGLHNRGGRFTEELEREMAAFAHALATYPVDGAMVMRPLQNSARDALIAAGRSSAELFLAEVREFGVDAVMKENLACPAGAPRWDFGDQGVLVDAMYSAYRTYCERSGMTACKRERLGQEMRFVFPATTRERVTECGKRPHAYQGLPRHGRVSP